MIDLITPALPVGDNYKGLDLMERGESMRGAAWY